ncbi:MAG: hypothetical protein AUG49_20555 [Catenulispora sp. 13_1_20CM_3_70_7]|nr:MAG: hypothetical protein AUG49_20555 [Catenulispora sp. 13_1_20CM_3_70_7]
MPSACPAPETEFLRGIGCRRFNRPRLPTLRFRTAVTATVRYSATNDPPALSTSAPIPAISSVTFALGSSA